MEIGPEPQEQRIHTVRVYRNTGKGANWWAEDDLGFAGGADHLSDLMASIREWAEAEGVLDDLSASLVKDAAEAVPEGHHLSLLSTSRRLEARPCVVPQSEQDQRLAGHDATHHLSLAKLMRTPA